MSWKDHPAKTHAGASVAGALFIAAVGGYFSSGTIERKDSAIQEKDAIIQGLEKDLERVKVACSETFGKAVDVVMLEGNLPGEGQADVQHPLKYWKNHPLEIEVADPLDAFLVNFRYDAIAKQAYTSNSGHNYGVVLQVQDLNGNEIERLFPDRGTSSIFDPEPWQYTAEGYVTIVGLDPGRYRIAVLEHGQDVDGLQNGSFQDGRCRRNEVKHGRHLHQLFKEGPSVGQEAR